MLKLLLILKRKIYKLDTNAFFFCSDSYYICFVSVFHSELESSKHEDLSAAVYTFLSAFLFFCWQKLGRGFVLYRRVAYQ